MSDPLPVARSGLRLETPARESFDVRDFTVEDGLSSLFAVDLEVVSPNPAIDLDDLIGQPAAFHIELGDLAYPDTPRRSWSGVISEAHLVRSEPSGVSTYQLTISPSLWLLTRRTNCRVFQQQTDLDVARSLLADWGLDAQIECSRSYKTRKYRVQYQETDHAFFSRLLEASGVTYFHRLVDGASKIVLADAPERAPARSETLDFDDEPTAQSRSATHFRASRSLTAGRIAVADHDHRLANRPLVAEAGSSRHPTEARIESFAYEPGAFRFGNPGTNDTPSADDRGRTRTDLDEGQRIAEQKSAAAMARARRFAFDANALDLAPGMVLSIGQHPMAERAGPLLVVRTTITGSHDAEANVAVHAAAAGSPYKPDAVTPVPLSSGVECAVVVGPEGETIHTDEFGRVRVQFHWDRYGKMDEQSSCWVPVAQAWAGDGLGAMNLPRVGQEVIVSFLGGNPEEPMIVGRMFTNLLRPPFSLPANKTQNGFRSASVPATGGYNMLMFEDLAGSEEIRIRAEKDWNTQVNNDTRTSIGRHRTASVVGNDKEEFRKFEIAGVGPTAQGGGIRDARYPKKSRTGIKFHYDGNNPGTEGCIGYDDPAAQQALTSAHAAGDRDVRVIYVKDDAEARAMTQRLTGKEPPVATRGHGAPARKKPVAKKAAPKAGQRASERTRTKHGARLAQGEPTVMLGSKMLVAAHVDAAHDRGGKVAEGSSTVFVGRKLLPFGRVDDPTTDGSVLVSGEDTVMVG